MYALYRLGVVLTIVVGLAASVSPAAAQLPATSFTVVYDHLDSKLARAVAGTLGIDAEFVRFQARHQPVAWTIPLLSIESITLEDTLTPAKMRIRCVIIATREGGVLVKRRIAAVDDELRIVTPAVLSGVMREHWNRVTTPRSRVTARQQ